MSGKAIAPVPDGGSNHNNDIAVDMNWFEEDDDETLKLLISKTWQDDLPTRLEMLAKRFQHDVDPAKEDVFWQSLMSSANALGFESINSLAALEGAAAPSTSGGQGDTCGCPSAFQSEVGMMHVRAVASFLGVSDRRSIQLTMSTLRTHYSTYSNNSERSLLALLPSLLGTQTMLRQVVGFYYSRRISRLCAIAECLRIEQDAADTERHPSVSNLLSSLDSSRCCGDGRQRGLFRRLLAVACESHTPPTVAALAPALELKSDSESQRQPLQASDSKYDGRHRRWNQFISDCVEASRLQKDLERSEAMEVLLLLLYQRIKGGVQRDDYLCLLLAFSKVEFFANQRDLSRLSHKAGLMCAECMGLWRIFAAKQDDEDIDWIFSHPMLEGLLESSIEASEAAASELEILKNLLQRLGEHAMERSTNALSGGNSNVMKPPESLAVLSFGLFLSQSFTALLASGEGSDAQAYWQTFRVTGFGMAKVAGNEYGALDFLQMSLVDINDFTEPPPVRSPQTAAYDWLLHLSSSSDITLDSAQRFNAMSITYSSLGLEVLQALIATFQDTALSLDHPGAAANIGMLCDLAAVVYRNEPMLCDPFLAEWTSYDAGDRSCASELPMCYLMDAASKLATTAVNFSMEDQAGIEVDFFLPSIAPLLRLVSSLCHCSDVVETVLATLPRGLMRKALLHTRKIELTESFRGNRIRVLDSISTLLRIGTSHSCRKMFMSSLEVKGSKALDAPRLILTTIAGSDDIDILPFVLSITADLLQSSCDEPRWAVNVAHLLLARESTMSMVQLLSDGRSEVLIPATKVLLALSESLSSVIVNPVLAEKEKSQYMEQVLDGILASFGVLISSMTSLGNHISFAVIENILLGISSFLNHLQPILHLESNIAVVAAHARDILVNALVVKGEAIAYFAVLPISFQLSALMDDAYQRESIFGNSKTEESLKSTDPLTQRSRHPSQSFNLKIVQIISELPVIQFDFETLKSRNWIQSSDHTTFLGAATAAVRVLILWASHIESIFVDRHGDYSCSNDWNSEVRSEVNALSPQDLLSSLMVAPPPIRKSPVLSELWSSLSFSNIELLMRYVTIDGSNVSTLIPTVAVLDLLATSMSHLKFSSSKIEDSTLFRTLRLSPHIRLTLWEFVMSTREILRNDEFKVIPANHGRLACCLRALRILHVAIDKNLVLATALLLDESRKADIIHPLFDCVKEAVSILERTPMDRLGQEDTTIMKLRLATGCLGIIQLIRKSARAMNSIATHVSPFSSFISDTALFCSLWQIVVRFLSADGNTRHNSVILSFFALVLETFTTEMAWAFQNKDQTSTMLGDLFRNTVDLIPILRSFTKFSGFDAFLSSAKHLFAEVGLQPSVVPAAAILSFHTTPSKYLEQDFLVRDNPFDVFAAARWFSTVLPTGTNPSTLTTLIADFASARTTVSNECYFLGALVHFSGVYISLQDQDVVGLARASLQWIRLHAESFETSLSEPGNDALRSETVEMVNAFAGLVLTTTSTTSGCFRKTGADSLIALLVDLNDACGRLVTMLGISSQTNKLETRKVCVAQQGLLASAVAIGQNLEAHSNSTIQVKEMTRLDQANLELTEVACKVLGIVQSLRSNAGKLNEADRCVFITCAALMRMVLSQKISSRDGEAASDSFLLRFGQVLREYKVINLFGFEAHRASQLDVNKETSILVNAYPGEQSDLRVLAMVVDFLRAIVESRHPVLLSLFSQARVAEVIIRNPLITFASGVVWSGNGWHQRGYLPSQTSRQGVATDDPVHKLWIKVLHTVKSFLRISASQDPDSEYFAEIAADFINSNKLSIVSCLKACSARPLTLNILKEANSILSMFSQAFVSGRPDGVHPDVHEELSSALTGVVICISNFLGASGAAHELFHILERLDFSGDGWDTSNSKQSPAHPAHPLLAAGVPNARHEGIRYAHFAFQCLAVMTDEDYKESSALILTEQNHAMGPQSPSTIERKGRNTMGSEFHRRVEQAAAECLFHALLVVWRLHPAASAFVPLSPGATGRSDTWPLVKPGMLIAYHRSFDIGLNNSEMTLQVARILHVDTVHRSWRVRVVRSGPGETSEIDENVQLHQLFGIENLDKRRCLFQQIPAPDSAAELEQQSANSFNRTVTLGHLILVLRWCYQQKPSEARMALTQELAELCVAILGTEVSLYREIGAGDGGISVASKRIEEQLFNLFGDPSDQFSYTTDAAATVVLHSRELRRNDLLNQSVLAAARAQLDPELRKAQIELEIKRRKQTESFVSATDGGVGFGSVRRSSGAFRGLRVPLD